MIPYVKTPRTPEQIAEELEIRRHHAENPIREVPKSAINQRSIATYRKLLVRLQQEREAQGLSLAEVASRMGVEEDELKRTESMKRLKPAAFWTMLRWAEVLGCQLQVELTPQAEEKS